VNTLENFTKASLQDLADDLAESKAKARDRRLRNDTSAAARRHKIPAWDEYVLRHVEQIVEAAQDEVARYLWD
jgi:hypothetical protein